MKHMHFLSQGDTLVAEDFSHAVRDFIDKFQMKPDCITVHHATFEGYFRSQYGGTNGMLEYKENGTILLRTYIGYLPIELTFAETEKVSVSNNLEYILVENKEAQKADKILLGEDEEV